MAERKYNAVLFDLDGTLTESGPGIMGSFRYAFRKLGLPLDENADLSIVIGPPLAWSFPQFGVPAERVDEAIKAYREDYNAQGKFNNRPYDGIAEMLQKLKDDGIKLYVATSKPEKMAREIIDHFDLTGYFEEIAGASFDLTRNTKIAVIEYLRDKTGFHENAVMVGDTRHDIIGASQAGLDGIGVSWGYGSVEEMKKAGAVAVADSPQELYELLTK